MAEKMTTQELYGEALHLESIAKTAEKLAADANRVARDARVKAEVAAVAFHYSQYAQVAIPERKI